MKNKKWAPSQEENLGAITSVYKFIKEELSELQKETGCPDSFIYDFIGKIQNEWHPESCHSIVRNKKRKNQKILKLQLKHIKILKYNQNLKYQIMIIIILGIILILGTIAYYGLVLTGQSNLQFFKF